MHLLKMKHVKKKTTNLKNNLYDKIYHCQIQRPRTYKFLFSLNLSEDFDLLFFIGIYSIFYGKYSEEAN